MSAFSKRTACCVCSQDDISEAQGAQECICEHLEHHQRIVKRVWKKIQKMGKFVKAEESPEGSSVSSDSDDDGAEDGGWGWAVCFGSFLINFILDGTMFSFGLLLIELLDYFGEGKSKTAWIGSSLLGMSMFMGPIVSMLLERYSCRQITIAGTALSVVGFVVSSFSPNVEILIITYGIIGGIGFCMSFISAIIVVGTYFHRKRAIATGIAMSGSGLGTFAYAYLTNILLSRYDWRGTVLILGGILLNGIVCGALFRPVTRPKLQRSRSEDLSSNSSFDVIDIAEIKTLLTKKEPPFNYLRTCNLPSRLSMSTELACMQKDRILAEESHAKTFLSQHDFSKVLKPVSNQMSRTDVFYSGSLARLPHRCSSSAKVEPDSDDLSISNGKAYTADKSKCGRVVGALKRNFALFNNKIFVLLLLTNVGWTVQSVPLTYIPDLGISKGLPSSQAATLISIVGITNIFGRIISGIITDMFRIRSSVTYTAALFTASLVNFLMPWCESFLALATCGAIFGLCMATVVSMRTIVLADHLGIEQLTQSFGMVAMFQGVAFLTNAPLAGYLYETFDSYLMPFSFAGGMYFLSGIFCLILLCIDHGQNGKEEEIIIKVEKVPED
ncbi:monocarboxylate transporter 14-like isoform X1 [Ruditapes philippinarum]|uniref:monocarboxylate transporter 14-like isoform X1 n=2 Tax=Ruditapes philippinarum TaxID=129788 RepID=UPI00295B2100|nr:monocarboxylate transporter 14-like isoform X1 [Ruditapes philippinarum]